MSGKFAQYVAATHPERVLGLGLSHSAFPVPDEVGKAWCDAQRDRTAAFNLLLAPSTKLSLKPSCPSFSWTISPKPTGSRWSRLPCGHEIPQEMPHQTAAILKAFVAGLGHQSP